jgi:SAM-dependent methyltransferase
MLGVGMIAALVRRLRGHATGRHVAGGILIGDPAGYDTHTRRLLGSMFEGIAADIAMAAPADARILEIGSGPGHLSIRLARDHGLEVIGLDLDPMMVARAEANAAGIAAGPQPMFVVGDVADLPFDAGSFDLVVSTFSMHHWSDPKSGLSEVARVLRPNGRALVWDLKAGLPLFHRHAPDPLEAVSGSGLRTVRATPWRWPWRFSLSQRLELVRT